jgi:transcriptional regulator with XRE-family HTH domain
MAERESREPEDWLDYGAALRRLRHERGVGLNDLAARAAVSPSYLSEVERGFKRPSTDVLARIAGAFGVAPSELLAYVEASGMAGGVEAVAPYVAAEERAAEVPPEPVGTVTPPTPMEPPATRRARFSFLSASVGMHARERPPEAPRPDRLTPQPSDQRTPRVQTMQTLLRVAGGLSDDDLKMLLDLARRLLERA